MTLELDDNVMRSFQVGRTFTKTTEKASSCDFSPDGNFVVSCYNEEEIFVYDVNMATRYLEIKSMKYGVDIVRFTDTNKSAIHNSTKVDHDIRHLSLHDNKYIHYFNGHQGKVVSLCLSPTGGMFVSGSLDKTVKLWDLRLQKCTKQIKITGDPVTAFDPKGLVLGVGENSETLKLFDIRNMDKPFMTSSLLTQDKNWTDLTFSADGHTILIPTNGNFIRLINANTCKTVIKFKHNANNNGYPIDASFSPDSLYVLSGSNDGHIHVWNAFTGVKLCVLNSKVPGPIHYIKFNHKYMMLVSVGKDNMAFWVPIFNQS